MISIKFHYIYFAVMLAIPQLIFFTFAILTNKTSNKYFAAMLITLTFLISSSLAIPIFRISVFHPLTDVLNQGQFLAGPVLYLYFKTFFFNSKTKLKNLLHFFPFIFFLLASALMPKFNIWPGIPYLSILSTVTAVVTQLPYFILVLKMFKKDLFIKEKNLYFWLHFYIYGLFFIWLIRCISIVIWNIFRLYLLEFHAYDQFIYPIIVTCFFCIAAYIYLLIYTIFSQKTLYLKKIKYKYSQLNHNLKKEYKQKIEHFLINKQIFLDPDITLKQLARKLSILPNELSQILNEEYNMHFNDFINKYRIEFSKNQFVNDKSGQKTIIEILFDSGFNSKSTFNSAFKRHTQMTPKEYKNLIKNKKV